MKDKSIIILFTLFFFTTISFSQTTKKLVSYSCDEYQSEQFKKLIFQAIINNSILVYSPNQKEEILSSSNFVENAGSKFYENEFDTDASNSDDFDWDTFQASEIENLDSRDKINFLVKNPFLLIDKLHLNILGEWQGEKFAIYSFVFSISTINRMESYCPPIGEVLLKDVVNHSVLGKFPIGTNFGQGTHLFEGIRQPYSSINYSLFSEKENSSINGVYTAHKDSMVNIVYNNNENKLILLKTLKKTDFEKKITSCNQKIQDLRYLTVLDYYQKPFFDFRNPIFIQSNVNVNFIDNKNFNHQKLKSFSLLKEVVIDSLSDEHKVKMLDFVKKFHANELAECIYKHKYNYKEGNIIHVLWSIIYKEYYEDGKLIHSVPQKISININSNDINNVKGIELPLVTLSFSEMVNQLKILGINDILLKDYMNNIVHRYIYWIDNPDIQYNNLILTDFEIKGE